jgi:hypothetical protein
VIVDATPPIAKITDDFRAMGAVERDINGMGFPYGN